MAQKGEEDSPGTRDLVVVCGDATIATSTLLLAAAFPWVRELLEEVGEETALSLPSLTSSLLTTFLHSCVSGPWREDFTPVLTLLTPGGLQGPKTLKAEIASTVTAEYETYDESESFLSAAISHDSDPKNYENKKEDNEHVEKKKNNDLFLDWESDDEGDVDVETSKEPDTKTVTSNNVVLSKNVENCDDNPLGSLGLSAKPNVVVLENIKTENEKFDGIERPHMCTKCPKRFTRKDSLKKHIDKNKHKYNTIKKTKEATTKSLVEKYGVNPNDVVHKCTECDKSFKHKSNRTNHMVRYHNQVKKPVSTDRPFNFQYNSYICPHCQRDLNDEFPETDAKSMVRKQAAYRRHLKLCLVDQFTCSCSDYSSPTPHQVGSKSQT